MGDGTNVLSTIAVGGSDSFTVAGAFGGSSAMTKTGTGTLVITGNNTSFTGPMNVTAGQLKVNGSLQNSSLLTLSANTTLSGTGSIGPITCFGTLSPGNSVGTLSSGSVVLGNSSLFFVELDPSGASLLDVMGSATLNGTLEVVQAPGLYARSGQYPILQTTDGLSGSFSSILLFPLSGFTLSVLERGNDLILAYNSALLTEGLSGNALKLANYLNSYGSSSTIALFSGLSGNSLKKALNSASPYRNAFATYITEQMAFSLNGLVSGHMDSLRFTKREDAQGKFVSALTADASDQIATPVKSQGPKNRFSGWVSGFGEFSHQAASQQNPSFNFISEAVLAGLDYHGENRGIAGGTLGYAHTHYRENNHAGHGNINYYYASLYGNGFIGNFYMSPTVWGVFNETDNTRNISFPGFSKKAHADIFAWQLIPHLEVGYDIEQTWGDITPFSSIDWAISWQRGYREQGASPFNGKQKANNSSMVRSETGLKFCERWEKSWGAFLLKEKASYVFEKPFGIGNVNTAFVGTPGAFTLTSVDQNLNLGAAGLNFLIAVGKQNPIKIDFGYEGEFGSNYWSSELMLTFSKDF